MTLDMLIADLQPKSTAGSMKTEVGGVRFDSRAVEAGHLFVALSGEKTDGNEYIGQALEKGASVILTEAPVPEDYRGTWVQVRDAREAMAKVADTFYGHPSAELKIAGVTGTNGKTTTAFLLHHLMKSSWRRAGLIGTVRYETGEQSYAAPHTTPESPDIQRLLAEMRDEGCRGAVMEVASHGLAQQRVGAVKFDVAIFTNLTQDHLDYHKTFENYFAAKRRLFEILNDQGAGKPEKARPTMVINRDDKYGARLIRPGAFPNVNLITYGMGAQCDFKAVNLRSGFSGTTFQLETAKRSVLVKTPLIGRYNVYNALAALTAAQALDLNFREAVHHLAETPQVPGRLEAVGEQTSFKVFVDYAHTPDALENAIRTVRELEPARLITVFGCGGDRDRAKRPMMGRAASELSDVAVVTSDNPRTESPAAIIEDIRKGLVGSHSVVIEDRREAIREAIARARERDIVLIAGKGHETYQEIDGVRHPFDDCQVAAESIRRRFESY